MAERALAGAQARRFQFRGRHWGPYLVIAPGLLFLVALSIYPMIYDLRVSFYNWYLTSATHPFVGLQNYAQALTSSGFWKPLGTTVVFVVVVVPIELILGLALALLLIRSGIWEKVARSLLLLPFIMAPAAIGILWVIMFNYQYGVVNYLLSLVGVAPRDWLSDPTFALPSVMAVDIWEWTPFVFLIVLAGLQAIPPDLIEAARVEGASWWHTVLHIQLPLARDTILVAVIFRSIIAFRVYDLVFMMTRGGPVDQTTTLSWTIYNNGFSLNNMSFSATYGWLTLIVILVAARFVLRVLERRGA
jgi:multiple sugar transport system permease protein